MRALVTEVQTWSLPIYVASGLPWRFTAHKPVKLRLGEERLVAYKGKNIGNGPYLGTAAFNVTPFKTGEYFSKIECFCFTEQLLLPGEEKEFTVSFRSEEHTSELQSLMRISYAVFCLKKKKIIKKLA